jgi:hypothetical protein
MLATAVTLALLASASAADGTPDARSRSFGLTAMGAAACAETEAFCATTVLPALAEDPKLSAFLADARAAATRARADSDGDASPSATGANAVADNYRAVVATAALRFPELLALGCCLAAGACADDVAAASSGLSAEASKDASRRAAAEALALAADAPEAAHKMPAAALLGANAFACRPPDGASRCGAETVSMYRRAGTAGFEAGAMRAGEALLARFAGPFVDESSDSKCPLPSETSKRDPPAGDRADAAAAKALFRQLLVSPEMDKRAALRLKELQRAEEMWLVKSGDNRGEGHNRGRAKHDEADIAFVLAAALVDGALRLIAVAVLCVVAFFCRNTRVGVWFRSFVWRYSGCAGFARRWRLVMEAFGVTPHRRVSGGRAAARAVERASAKKMAKQIVKEILKQEKNR